MTNDAQTEQAKAAGEAAEPSAITARWLDMLQHALGLDAYGQGRASRDRYVTGEGSDDYPDCMAMVEAGLMTRRAGATLPFGGMDCFYATEEGRKYVLKHSPRPPKLTPAQRRYQRWIDADSDLSFGEWLKKRERLPRA